MGGSSLWSDPRIAALFATTPDRFVTARNALAAELAAAGDPAAREVRALRRPTRRLWILNRLARQRPDDVARLLEAGADLKRAHAAALQGEGKHLREADEAMSRRLDELVRAATALLDPAGGRPDHALLVSLRTDLRAVATGGGLDAERLRAGTLDHVPAGPRGGAFGDLAGSLPGSPRAARRAQPGEEPGGRSATRARKEAADEARARSREEASRVARARAELRSAEQAVAAAERSLQRRERDALRAEATAAKLRSRADEARRAVAAARERLGRARGAVRA